MEGSQVPGLAGQQLVCQSPADQEGGRLGEGCYGEPRDWKGDAPSVLPEPTTMRTGRNHSCVQPTAVGTHYQTRGPGSSVPSQPRQGPGKRWSTSEGMERTVAGP